MRDREQSCVIIAVGTDYQNEMEKLKTHMFYSPLLSPVSHIDLFCRLPLAALMGVWSSLF